MFIEEGIWFEDNPNNLIEPITFENDIRDCFRQLRYQDCNPHRYLINPYGDIYDKKKNRLLNNYDAHGYRRTSLEYPDRSKSISVHRLVATNYCVNPDPENWDIVNHIDGEKSNNYYKNLEWCTQQHNFQHGVRTGLIPNPKGETNGNSHITNNQAEQICYCMEKGMKYADILEECGLEINKQNLDILTKIRSKKLWKWVSDKYNIPEKENRTPQIIYTDEQLHQICKMIQDGCSNKEIYTFLGIDMSIKKESDKFYKFIMRVRRRQTYTHISKDYKW